MKWFNSNIAYALLFLNIYIIFFNFLNIFNQGIKLPIFLQALFQIKK